MNQNFSTGAELALKAFGIHDARQRQAMMEKLYGSQMETEGLRREQMTGQMQLFQLQLQQLVEGLKTKKAFGEEVRGILTPKIEPGDFEISGQQVPMEVAGPQIISAYGRNYPEEYYGNLAKELMKPEEFTKLGPEEILISQKTGKEKARGISKPKLGTKGQEAVDYETLKTQRANALVDQFKKVGIDLPYDMAVKVVAPELDKIFFPEKETTKSNIGKLIGEYNELDPKDPNRQYYLGAIKKQAESTGFQIRMNKDGTVEIIQGPIGPGGLTKQIETKIQEKAFNTQEQIARIDKLEQMFKPEYQEYVTKGGMWWNSIKAKAGVDLSEKEKISLTNFAAYKRTAIANINLYIKEITGAQMSEAEANRLRLAMPDPGEGIFGGDDPVSFKAKLDDVIKEIKLSIKRYDSLLKKGLSPENINIMVGSDTLPSLETFSEKPTKEKTVIKKFISPSTGKTKYIYSDGTEEIK